MTSGFALVIPINWGISNYLIEIIVVNFMYLLGYLDCVII